jgi:hypothetical protein
MSPRDTILADLKLSKSGEKPNSPSRTQNWIKGLVTSAALFQILVLPSLSHAQNEQGAKNPSPLGTEITQAFEQSTQGQKFSVDEKILYGMSLSPKEEERLNQSQWKKIYDTKIFLGEKLSDKEISHMSPNDLIANGLESKLSKDQLAQLTPSQIKKSQEIRKVLGEPEFKVPQRTSLNHHQPTMGM